MLHNAVYRPLLGHRAATLLQSAQRCRDVAWVLVCEWSRLEWVHEWLCAIGSAVHACMCGVARVQVVCRRGQVGVRKQVQQVQVVCRRGRAGVGKQVGQVQAVEAFLNALPFTICSHHATYAPWTPNPPSMYRNPHAAHSHFQPYPSSHTRTLPARRSRGTEHGHG